MEDFKIRVTTEQESKEAQELFFELGYSWPGCEKYYNRIGNYTFITAYPDEMLLRMGWGGDTNKEITIPQLKDMVVLKNNNVNDATHTDQDNWKWFVSSDGIGYVWMCGNSENLKQWDESPLDHVDLKSIKKEVVMKEYIAKVDGEWRLVDDSEVVSGRVEVPEGAEIYIEISERNQSFYKNDFASCFVDGTWVKTTYNLENRKFWASCFVLWQREKVEVESEKLDTDAMLADIDVQIATHSQHGHYFKDVRDLSVIDVYQVLKLFNVTDPCLQHIIKKALVAGGRGHKDFERDLKDIHDTSKRALEINNILH